ncbi:MAG: Na+/H+ antiporter subunit E [ANME-2 cluster archaeon]|nr:Na+/H+ antiporter subunit E [ANME-2 cluster archaeon]
MKRYLYYSIPLGIMWCFVHGTVSIQNFLFGLLLGPVVIRPFRELYDFDQELSFKREVRKIPKQIIYFLVLIMEITKASIMVSKIVISPKIDIKPGIIAVPLRTRTNGGITAIANTITLTPGTLTIDVADDRSVLYVHSIDASYPESIRMSIRDDLERFVLEAFE